MIDREQEEEHGSKHRGSPLRTTKKPRHHPNCHDPQRNPHITFPSLFTFLPVHNSLFSQLNVPCLFFPPPPLLFLLSLVSVYVFGVDAVGFRNCISHGPLLMQKRSATRSSFCQLPSEVTSSYTRFPCGNKRYDRHTMDASI